MEILEWSFKIEETFVECVVKDVKSSGVDLEFRLNFFFRLGRFCVIRRSSIPMNFIIFRNVVKFYEIPMKNVVS